jgi:hypothetical protein
VAARMLGDFYVITADDLYSPARSPVDQPRPFPIKRGTVSLVTLHRLTQVSQLVVEVS